MARARKIKETVTRRVKVDRIQLTLTEGEADFLQGLLLRTAGDAKKSPRKYQIRLSQALREATGQNPTDTDAWKLMRKGGPIWFNNYPVPEENVVPPNYWADVVSHYADQAYGFPRYSVYPKS